MTEYDSEVPSGLHGRILTLVHQDDSVGLDKLLKSVSLTESEVTESTLFIVSARRNLLHIASYNQAKNCTRLLVNPPYCWNADHLDGLNRTPFNFAEVRDDLAVFVELAPHSRELHPWDLVVPDSAAIGNLTTVLFWPQDFYRRPFSRSALLSIRPIGISGCFRYLGEQFVYKTRMIGPHVALLFELFMATPSLFAFNLWNGEVTATGAIDQFWPIPIESMVFMDDIPVHENCTIYPQCLYQTSLACLRRNEDSKSTLIALMYIWISHRFGFHNSPGSKRRYIGQLPSLMELCRMVIRRCLVQHMISNKIESNYMQILRKLKQPESVEQFLLYRPIWDTGNDWEKYLIDGHGGNVPYGARLTATHCRGTLIGHRFIPDSTHS